MTLQYIQSHILKRRAIDQAAVFEERGDWEWDTFTTEQHWTSEMTDLHVLFIYLLGILAILDSWQQRGDGKGSIYSLLWPYHSLIFLWVPELLSTHWTGIYAQSQNELLARNKTNDVGYRGLVNNETQMADNAITL